VFFCTHREFHKELCYCLLIERFLCPTSGVRGSRSCSLPLVNIMTLREIYQTTFDEDIQPDSRTSSCPECNGRVATNAVETRCEDCGHFIEAQKRVNHI